MKTCSCGFTFDPNEAKQLGTVEGMKYFDCPSCGSTLCETLPEHKILVATWKALRIKATIEELEEYLENERKAG